VVDESEVELSLAPPGEGGVRETIGPDRAEPIKGEGGKALPMAVILMTSKEEG